MSLARLGKRGCMLALSLLIACLFISSAEKSLVSGAVPGEVRSVGLNGNKVLTFRTILDVNGEGYEYVFAVARARSKVATPTFGPGGGTYSSAQNVSIQCTTVGATIRYTTNGAEPSSTSTVYSSPVSVTNTTTIKAKAFMNGMTDSNTASAIYTINVPLPKVSTPTFGPGGGTYSSAQNVALACSTVGATIRYTTDGSEPVSSSTAYSTPIPLSSTTTLKAKAFLSGMTDSDTASAIYTIILSTPKVSTPTFNPGGGTYSSVQSVVIQCATSGATIRYTIDGSEPSSSSTVYSGPMSVSRTTTVKAKAFMSGMMDSDTASATYTINPSTQTKVSTPTLTPSSGTYSSAQNVTLSCSTSGATIRYTTDGYEPSSSSAAYFGPVSVRSTTTIKAKALMPGMTDSDTVSATYTIETDTTFVDQLHGNWLIYTVAGVAAAGAIVGGVLYWRKRKKAPA